MIPQASRPHSLGQQVRFTLRGLHTYDYTCNLLNTKHSISNQRTVETRNASLITIKQFAAQLKRYHQQVGMTKCHYHNDCSTYNRLAVRNALTNGRCFQKYSLANCGMEIGSVHTGKPIIITCIMGPRSSGLWPVNFISTL